MRCITDIPAFFLFPGLFVISDELSFIVNKWPKTMFCNITWIRNIRPLIRNVCSTVEMRIRLFASLNRLRWIPPLCYFHKVLIIAISAAWGIASLNGGYTVCTWRSDHWTDNACGRNASYPVSNPRLWYNREGGNHQHDLVDNPISDGWPCGRNRRHESQETLDNNSLPLCLCTGRCDYSRQTSNCQ